MSELKPCPFCGEKAKAYHEESWAHGEGYYVSCTNCGVRQWWLFNFEADAIEAWNRRTKDER